MSALVAEKSLLSLFSSLEICARPPVTDQALANRIRIWELINSGAPLPSEDLGKIHLSGNSPILHPLEE